MQFETKDRMTAVIFADLFDRASKTMLSSVGETSLDGLCFLLPVHMVT